MTRLPGDAEGNPSTWRAMNATLPSPRSQNQTHPLVGSLMDGKCTVERESLVVVLDEAVHVFVDEDVRIGALETKCERDGSAKLG